MKLPLKRIILIFLIPFISFAQNGLDYYLPKTTTYNKAIITPKQYLGYEVGEQHVTPYEVYGYFREVAKQSDRIKLEIYAKSYENRELMLATVSSPENHKNILHIQDSYFSR